MEGVEDRLLVAAVDEVGVNDAGSGERAPHLPLRLLALSGDEGVQGDPDEIRTSAVVLAR